MNGLLEEAPGQVDVAALEALWAQDAATEAPAAEMATSDAPEGRRTLLDPVYRGHQKLMNTLAEQQAAIRDARDARDADGSLGNHLRYAGKMLTSGTLVIAAGLVVSRLIPGVGNVFGSHENDQAVLVTAADVETQASSALHLELAAFTADLPTDTVTVADGDPSFADKALAAVKAAVEDVKDVVEADPSQAEQVTLRKGSHIWGNLGEWADDHGYDEVAEGNDDAALAEVKNMTLDYQNGGVLDDGKGMSEEGARHIDGYLRPSDDQLFAAFDAAGATYDKDDVTPGATLHPDDRVPPPPPPGEQEPGGDGAVPPEAEGWWDKNAGLVFLAGAAALTGAAVALAVTHRRGDEAPAVVDVHETEEYQRERRRLDGDDDAVVVEERRTTATNVGGPGVVLPAEQRPDDDDEEDDGRARHRTRPVVHQPPHTV